jgi:hypothetical protein
MNGNSTPQVAFVLGCFLGQNVALKRLTALNGTTRTNTKALLCAALGLHFGHVNAPIFIAWLGGRRCLNANHAGTWMAPKALCCPVKLEQAYDYKRFLGSLAMVSLRRTLARCYIVSTMLAAHSACTYTRSATLTRAQQSAAHFCASHPPNNNSKGPRFWAYNLATGTPGTVTNLTDGSTCAITQ